MKYLKTKTTVLFIVLALFLAACGLQGIADEVAAGAADVYAFQQTRLPADSPKLNTYRNFSEKSAAFRDALRNSKTPEGKFALLPALAELTKVFRLEFKSELAVENPLLAFVLDRGLSRLSGHFTRLAEKNRPTEAVALGRGGMGAGESALRELEVFLASERLQKPK